jgi:hypothetical protein
VRWLARLAATAVLGCSIFVSPFAAASQRVRSTWWHPGPLRSWAYVIGENYPLRVPPVVAGVRAKVQAVDADLGDQSGLAADGAPLADPTIESSVKAIHAMGAHAICYVDAGTAENWRSDYHKFDPSEIGRQLPGWQGERFIDAVDWSKPVPSRYETIETIMRNRIALCAKEGFDAIEADNVDAYTFGDLGGFRLSMAEEETYVERLIAAAHRDGLAFFLKNGIDGDTFLKTLAPLVDGEVNEQCWQFDECSPLRIFVREHKPILNVEYQHIASAKLCPKARAFPMATIRARLLLTGPITYGCWT